MSRRTSTMKLPSGTHGPERSPRNRWDGTCSAMGWWYYPTAGYSSTVATCGTTHSSARCGARHTTRRPVNSRIWKAWRTGAGTQRFRGPPDEYGGGDLYGRFGMEPGISVRLDPSSLSTNAPVAQRQRLRLRPRARVDDVQYDDEDLVPGGFDQVQRNAHLWL